MQLQIYALYVIISFIFPHISKRFSEAKTDYCASGPQAHFSNLCLLGTAEIPPCRLEHQL